MAMNLAPLGAINAAQQMPVTPMAAPQQEGSFMDMFKSQPLGLALLQGGLSMLSGATPGESFAQGLGLYNQYAAADAAAARQKIEDQYKQAELGLKEREVGAKETTAEAALIRAKKAGSEKDVPKGVDPKRWNAALDTVMSTTPLGEDPDMTEVYRTYNTMLGEDETPVYQALDNTTAQSLLTAMEANPDLAPQYVETAKEIYGPREAMRLQSLLERKMKAAQKEGLAEAKETEKAADELPEALKPRNILKNVQSISAIQNPTTAPSVTPLDIYRVMYPSTAPNPWAGMTPEMAAAMAGK